QRASGLAASVGNALDHIFGLIGIELPGRKIIEEKKRFCTEGEDIINTHGHKVYANCILLVHHKCYFKLRPYAVSPADEHRLFITHCVKLKQGAEGTDVGEHFRPESLF